MKRTRIKTGTMMYPEIIRLCDDNIKLANVRSRNDFIEEAIKFYIGYLHKDDNTNYMNQVIDETISNKTNLLEEKLSAVLFKWSVELSMLMNVIAVNNSIDQDTLKVLRNKCINDVKASVGKINVENIFLYQNLNED